MTKILSVLFVIWKPSEYRTMEDFITKSYFGTVTSSDEAFIWVIMNAYYDRWKNNEKGKAGAVMGFTDTACKKMNEFRDYDDKTSKSREKPNAALWSDKLMETARELARERDVDIADTDEVVPVESDDEREEKNRQREYIRRTMRAIGGESDDDDDSADDENDDNGDNTGYHDDNHENDNEPDDRE